MAEASGTTDKIRVMKPSAYEKVPTPEPTGSGTGTAGSPFYHPEASGPIPDRPSPIRGIEGPISDKTSSDALVDAIQTVFAVAAAEIAFHEREAAKLRKALEPFAEASRHSDAPGGYSADMMREYLLRFAREHKPEG